MFQYTVFVVFFLTTGIMDRSILRAQEDKKPDYSMAELSLLQSIEGEWVLAEYNEDGARVEWKRKMFSDARITEDGVIDYLVNIGGGNFPVKIRHLVTNIDEDNELVEFEFDTNNAEKRVWAKISKDQIVFCGVSDKATDQHASPKDFEPREGLTLMKWTRKPANGN